MPEFDSVALNYDHLLNAGLSATGETKEFFARGRVTRLRQRLTELGHRAQAVLDFGCGPGSTTPLLRTVLGAERVIGLDVSEGLLEVARRESNDPAVTFVTPDCLPPDLRVDVVYCNGVFHHIRACGAAEIRPMHSSRAASERDPRALGKQPVESRNKICHEPHTIRSYRQPADAFELCQHASPERLHSARGRLCFHLPSRAEDPPPSGGVALEMAARGAVSSPRKALTSCRQLRSRSA